MRRYPEDLCRIGVGLDELLSFNAQRGDFGPGDPGTHVLARLHEIKTTGEREVEFQMADGQILLIKDVTETRRLQELLNHHRRLSAKTELAAALAHQIRTPLAAAMLHTSNLGMHACGDERAARTAGRALDAMRQLERLVEDMLTYARGGKLDAEAFGLRALIDRLLANVKSNTPASEFRCTLARDVPDLTLVGNTDALVSMMLNMINNARTADFGPVDPARETGE